ncbi:MAG: two-component system response regulator CreB [Lentisphaeria bacterium]|nr:two-component system response regulator CreB [Lentisphaeria bacterium]
MKRILIIEDEASIAYNIEMALELEGYTSHHVPTLEEGHKQYRQQDFDFIILDLGLPDGNGLDFCKEVRKDSCIPLIILTARNDEIDRIVGLEVGADDYMTKPFSPRELTARIRAIFRRCEEYASKPVGSIKAPKQQGFELDEDRCTISYQSNILDLSAQEYRLLQVLLDHPKRVFSRRQLLEKVWQDPLAAMERTVDAHIKSIRAQLRQYTSKDLIRTHRGLGYSFDNEVSCDSL